VGGGFSVFCGVFGFWLGFFFFVRLVRLVLGVLVEFVVRVVVWLMFVVVCCLWRHWIRFVHVRHSSGIWFGFWWSVRFPVR